MPVSPKSLANLRPYKKGSKRASDSGKKSKTPLSLKATLKKQLNSNETTKEELIASVIKTSKKNPAMFKIVCELLGELLQQGDPNNPAINVNMTASELKKYQKQIAKDNDF